jgi:excinuclease ABC subunit C
MKITAELQLKLNTLPTSPGVYQFKNASGKIIYIGKAKNLKARVRTYFQKSGRIDPKTARMVSHVADLDLLVTDSEIESLILEANLVHEYKPRYNVRLKDDKHFPYIKVTTNEPFPRVFVVRRLEPDGASYFGPYTSSKSMRRTLQLLTRLFKIRTCNLVIPPPKGKKYQVCLDYHIKRCGGPCEGFQSQEEYAELVNAVIMVLRGKSSKIIVELEQKMSTAAEHMEFETAAELRDQVQALKDMQHRQSVDVGEMVDRDIVSLAREDSVAVAVVMQIREGVLIGRQDFQLEVDSEDAEETILESFVTQYYHAQPNLPGELFLPLDIQDVSLIEAWLRQSKGEKVTVVTPRIGKKTKLVGLAARNARLLLDELLIQKRSHNERTSKMVSALQDQLKLPRAPRRMICFDISNTGENDAVGSGAFFENGRPKKTEYRHFKIKGVRGQDDFKMMREVIGRYFHRLKEEDKPPPDLVVVDGGKGQLSSAKQELASLGFETQPIISLAKRLEEVYLPGLSDPMTIPRSSPALILLKRIRDEAHRFAITYNRKVRSKRTIKSALDEIPGIGTAKREVLLRTFGSVARIKELSIEELAAAKGITMKIAETIKKHLGRL